MALSLKSQANAHFTSSRYRESLDLYTASLNKNPFDPIVWSNRAAARLKLEEYGLAIADSSAFFSSFLSPLLSLLLLRFSFPFFLRQRNPLTKFFTCSTGYRD